MKSFFKKAGGDVRKAFSKNSQRTVLRKMSHVYQDSIPAVRIAGEIAGNAAPLALAIPGYGPAIAMGLQGAQAGSKLYGMSENKHKPAVMPRNSIQAPKPEEAKKDVFY